MESGFSGISTTISTALSTAASFLLTLSILRLETSLSTGRISGMACLAIGGLPFDGRRTREVCERTGVGYELPRRVSLDLEVCDDGVRVDRSREGWVEHEPRRAPVCLNAVS